MIVLLAVVCLAFASCGSGDADEPSADVDPAGVESDDAPSVDTVAASDSPLEARLGFPSDPERRRFQLISMQRAADETMVRCMKQAGFFYAARPAEEVFRSGAFIGDGTRAWTEANGLGITSSFAAALAADAASVEAGGSDATTTNADYVASLTEAQALDYDRALVGEAASDPSATAYQPGGCFAEAYTEVLQLVALIEEFETGLASLNSRLSNDPRVVAFRSEWSACMEGEGYDYADENALAEDVYGRLLEIELVDRDGVRTIASVDDLDELRVYEREVALAAFDCRQEFVDELDRLRQDYEREFLDDNRFRIADLLAPDS